MAVVLDAVDGGTSSTSTITSAGASPNGSDRLMLVCATGRSAADDVKTGGSGGTSLTKISGDASLFFDTWLGNVWRIFEGPTGSTTAWVDFGSGTSSAFSVLYLEGVDQTTPNTTAQTAGPTGSSTPSLALTGLSAGQDVRVALMVGHLPSGLSGFTVNGSTTIDRQDYGPVDGERQSSTLWLSGVADGSGNVTIGGTLTSGFDTGEWYMYGFGINAASSGATAALTGVASTAAVGSVGVAHTQSTAGNASTGSPGTFAVSHAQATTGNASTSGVGTVANSLTVALTGNSSTGTAGSVSAGGDVTLAISGASATGEAGAVAPETSKAANGTESISSVGSVAQALQIALSGNASTGEIGSVTFVGDVTVAITGVQSTTSAGSVSPPAVPQQITGAPGGGGRPWVAHINGKRVTGSLRQIQQLIEELAEDQAEKAVEQGKELKKPRIVIQPGKAIAKMPYITQEQGKAMQAEIRSSYNEAYIKAKIKFAEESDEEETMIVLLS